MSVGEAYQVASAPGTRHNINMNSLAAHVLIASPALVDPNFRRTVVLLVKHDEDGALGLILNRPAPLPFHDVWEKLSQEPCPIQAPLFVGGPCGGPLMALHQEADLSQIEPLHGLHFTAEIAHIREMISRFEPTMKLFGGYAGWGPQQLEGEIETGGWLVLPATTDMVFGPHDELWETLYKQLYQQTRLSDWLHIKNIPPDPSLN
jgi:putative transcriptional regulator